MKLRITPIVATAVVACLLLFGGWFAYRQYVVKAPLEKLVQQYEGVNHVQFDITQQQISLKLDLEPGTDLRGLVHYIETDGKSLIGNRTLKWNVENTSSDKLDQLWSEALFPVAEAMENKKYTNIPLTLKQLAGDNESLQVSAEMDDDNVYISLTDGKASKYIILPRVPEKMGVWTNA